MASFESCRDVRRQIGYDERPCTLKNMARLEAP
jgi:hypothetical protein